MGELRDRRTKGLIEENLPGSIVDMIVSADDSGDPHALVVDNHDKVIGGRPVAPLNDQVVELFVVEGYRPLDEIVEGGDSIMRGLEANHEGLVRDSSGKIAAGSVVFRLSPFCERFFTLRLKLLGSAVASVRLPFREKLLDLFLVEREVLRLVVWPFVPIQTKPLHPLQNGVDRLLRRTGYVGILDAENEGPAEFPGEKPVEQRCTCSADMQIA